VTVTPINATKPERLSDADLVYQETLLSEWDTLQGALHHWQRYVGERYGLREGDQVTRDGTIVREPG
jgi:hypothetical protein